MDMFNITTMVFSVLFMLSVFSAVLFPQFAVELLHPIIAFGVIVILSLCF